MGSLLEAEDAAAWSALTRRPPIPLLHRLHCKVLNRFEHFRNAILQGVRCGAEGTVPSEGQWW